MKHTTPKEPHTSSLPFLHISEAINCPQCPTKEAIRKSHNQKIKEIDNE